MNILKFILASYGITFFLQHKAYPMLSKSEFFKKMLECTFCTGFHGGWISFLLLTRPEPVLRTQLFAELIAAGFAGAASTYIIDTIMTKIEEWNEQPVYEQKVVVDDD